jgi:hypothetical protein
LNQNRARIKKTRKKPRKQQQQQQQQQQTQVSDTGSDEFVVLFPRWMYFTS